MGKALDLDLDIRDDGVQRFNITAVWRYQTIETNSTTIRLKAPSGAERGNYLLIVNVTDADGSTTTNMINISLEGKDTAILPITIIVGVSVLLLSILIGYGVFIRVQERRQTDYLTSVGTDRPKESPDLTMEDFSTRGREYLAMPPSDLEDEISTGEFDRAGNEDDEDYGPDEEMVLVEDLDSEIDDVIVEFFRE
jgi:hypothetical protein